MSDEQKRKRQKTRERTKYLDIEVPDDPKLRRKALQKIYESNRSFLLFRKFQGFLVSPFGLFVLLESLGGTCCVPWLVSELKFQGPKKKTSTREDAAVQCDLDEEDRISQTRAEQLNRENFKLRALAACSIVDRNCMFVRL